ncbi:hypothetical protein DLAC_08250 [Tieghemostelium lacteum]|uniref:Small ribosomal subunit protein mS41 n=1 Tax=Tieghemostelium lacteum TaxID=361077 RepID=A0A151ZBP4_TIELA|nr:hypothetical protein DLAC_08250 [Tieghemostelium lacteum]|eukprot:KYQ91304.1 hypothetical protein DLAC_08250 [Tieghemostelium lacteum]
MIPLILGRNTLKSISLINNSSKYIYGFNQMNKRFYSADAPQSNSGDNDDVNKLFKITQEITQELGEEEKKLEDLEEKKKTVTTLKYGGSDKDFYQSLFPEEDDVMFQFDIPPSDRPQLPTFNGPLTIEDLIIEYQDPYATQQSTYQPYFRFTQPRDGYTVETFLKKIGRGCDKHVELFPQWEDLMAAEPKKLKKANVPVRERKWILHWVEEWKQGRNPVYITLSDSKSKRNLKNKPKN